MNFVHRFAVAEQAFYAIGSKKLLCGGQIARQRGAPKCALQGKFQRVHIEWLRQKINGAMLQRLNRLLTMRVPGIGDHRGKLEPLGSLLQQAQRIAGSFSVKIEVQQDEVRFVSMQVSNAVRNCSDLMQQVALPQNFLQNLRECLVRVNQEN